uniref:Uncharacterized protein n=1 Tax=Caenorhabditis japonica TaxID=281687 RepID=A0A8R1I587_CAEJA
MQAVYRPNMAEPSVRKIHVRSQVVQRDHTDFQCLKSSQTDCPKLTSTEFQTDAVVVQNVEEPHRKMHTAATIPQTQPLINEMDEVYWRIGKVIASLSVKDFPTTTAKKEVKNSGCEIFSQIRAAVAIIKGKLGSDSRQKIFHGINTATSAFSEFHRKTVAKHNAGNAHDEPKKKNIREMGKKEKARKIADKLTIYQREHVIRPIHETWADKNS